MTWKLVGAAAMALAVAACGTNPSERTTGGAAAGAATGAGIGALGGPVGALAGAAIGAGAGAVTGATTEPSTLNLGEPPWSNPQARVPLIGEEERSRSAGRRGGSSAGSGAVREAQRELAQRGYDPGTADGIWGAQTSRAAMAFQRANNMEATGRLDSRTMQALNIDDRAGAASGGSRTARTGADRDRDRAYMGGGGVDTRTGTTGAGTEPSTSGGMGSSGTGMNNTTGMGSPGSVGGAGIGSSTGTPSSSSGSQPGTVGTSTPR